MTFRFSLIHTLITTRFIKFIHVQYLYRYTRTKRARAANPTNKNKEPNTLSFLREEPRVPRQHFPFIYFFNYRCTSSLDATAVLANRLCIEDIHQNRRKPGE
jgi:hypothetical protein